MNPSEPRPELQQTLVGEGVARMSHTPTGDPYAILDDLMVVVEALCPHWPSRASFEGSRTWIL